MFGVTHKKSVDVLNKIIDKTMKIGDRVETEVIFINPHTDAAMKVTLEGLIIGQVEDNIYRVRLEKGNGNTQIVDIKDSQLRHKI